LPGRNVAPRRRFPLRRCAVLRGPRRRVAASPGALMRSSCPSECCCVARQRAVWVARPRRGLHRFRLTCAVLRAPPSPVPCGCGFILSWACLLFRDPTTQSGPPRARGEHLPWGSAPPSRHQCEESTWRQGSRPCLCSARSVSHALDGFLLFTPCRLVSSGCHVRGSLFRGFSRWPARRARRPPVPSCRSRSSPTRELPPSRQLRPRRLQGFDPTTDSLSRARRLRLTSTRSPPEIPAPSGFSSAHLGTARHGSSAHDLVAGSSQ